MKKGFSCHDMRGALKTHNLMFHTQFFASLGLANPDDIANRFTEESEKSFQVFLKSFGNIQQQVRADSAEPHSLT